MIKPALFSLELERREGLRGPGDHRASLAVPGLIVISGERDTCSHCVPVRMVGSFNPFSMLNKKMSDVVQL